MKRRLFTFALAALTIGLLGSCSKINERIDGLDKRVYDIENEKIASIENQIAAINASIADLGAIRKDILDLQVAVGAKGEDIAELKAADEALGKRIDTLQTYVDTKLAKYATKDWANAAFATLGQLNTTNTELGALKETVGNLGETFDGKLADLKTELTDAIDNAISGINATISALEARVSALEKMIQSVSITPAYSDGSVEAVDGILTLKCIVSPAEALTEMESLKDSLLIYADSVKVKTKAAASVYMEIKVSEATVTDTKQGAITLKADISEYLPKGKDKALTVAVNIKNGISDFTTEFVPVYVPNKTFKAVYNTSGGANTLTFYYDANDHSGEGTVYDNLPTAATKAADWGYNSNRGNIKSVVIDASVADYKGLTSTAFMFQGMTTATNISGAEHLDVLNVTDMSYMFNNFGGGASGNPTTLNVVPDVSKWNTGNVTNMTGMFAYYGNNSELDKVPDVSGWNTSKVENMQQLFQKYGHESQTFNAVPDVSKWNTGNVTNMTNMFFEYGHKSTVLNTVPNVSGWNTGKVENMQQMFCEYGKTSQNISCVLDLSGWDLSKITGTNGVNVFKFNPKTFDVTIPAKTGEKSNESGKWYYGNGDESITPPEGKTFTPALAGVFSVSATKKVRFSQGNLTYNVSTTTWAFYEHQYDCATGYDANLISLFTWGYGTWSTSPHGQNYQTGDFTDWGSQIGDGNTWRTLTKAEWQYLFNYGDYTSDVRNGKYKWATVNGVNGYVIAPDDFSGELAGTYTDDAALAANNLVFLPAAGYRDGSSVRYVGSNGYYWSSTAYDSDFAYCVSFSSSNVNPGNRGRYGLGCSVRLVTEVPASASTIESFNKKNDDSSNWN